MMHELVARALLLAITIGLFAASLGVLMVLVPDVLFEPAAELAED